MPAAGIAGGPRQPAVHARIEAGPAGAGRQEPRQPARCMKPEGPASPAQCRREDRRRVPLPAPPVHLPAGAPAQQLRRVRGEAPAIPATRNAFHAGTPAELLPRGKYCMAI
jgi:hypothetical protein